MGITVAYDRLFVPVVDRLRSRLVVVDGSTADVWRLLVSIDGGAFALGGE
jgi:hypothetical protein